jgi:hypothetical protein
MNSAERIQLEKMIQVNGAVDNTETIRSLKHSEKIRDDVLTMVKLKKDYQRLSKSNPSQFDAMCVSRCSFLFNTYTDLFNRLKKDELDLNIMGQLLGLLKMIEDDKIDQHTASFEVGKLLKSIYIDSALKKSQHLDDAHKHDNDKKKSHLPEKKLSWSEYKKTHLGENGSK